MGELIEQVASPRLGVVFDCANVVRIGDDLLAAAAALASHTKMIHVKDLDLGSSTPGDPEATGPVCLSAGVIWTLPRPWR